MNNFYHDDFNSRVLPGKKDVPSVRMKNESKRVKERKRYFLDDIDNLHIRFKEKYPNNQVSRTIFFQLCPVWIIPMLKQSQEVCQCICHENINLLLESLCKYIRSNHVNCDLHEIQTSDVIWEKTVCGKYNLNCVRCECTNCSVDNIDILFSFHNNNLLDEIELFQWKGVTYQEGKNKVSKKVKSVVTVSDALAAVKEQLYPFSYHMYVYIVQLHLSKCQNHGVVDGEVIISEDFSENYSIKHQDEIMSAHWSQQSITLFCATAHYLKNGVKTLEHYILCSDDMGHDKNNVYFYNSQILEDLKKKYVNINNVQMDHPGNLKTNTIYVIFDFTWEDHGMVADWNFFATSHGKGENDGAGGDVKNGVWRKVLHT